MLSGETSIGKYPVETVQMMARIAEIIEGAEDFPYNHLLELLHRRRSQVRGGDDHHRHQQCDGSPLKDPQGGSDPLLDGVRAHSAHRGAPPPQSLDCSASRRLLPPHGACS